MRGIKFRAWDKKRKKIYPWSHIAAIHHFDDEIRVNGGDDFVNVKFEDCELEQFTGLKDKNGREIYEGDILNIKIQTLDQEWIEAVEYKFGYFTGVMRETMDGCHGEDPENIEVIGNIHSNPELLK